MKWIKVISLTRSVTVKECRGSYSQEQQSYRLHGFLSFISSLLASLQFDIKVSPPRFSRRFSSPTNIKFCGLDQPLIRYHLILSYSGLDFIVVLKGVILQSNQIKSNTYLDCLNKFISSKFSLETLRNRQIMHIVLLIPKNRVTYY